MPGGRSILAYISGRQAWVSVLLLLISLYSTGARTQTQEQQQNIPDAPSATRPPQPFPNGPAASQPAPGSASEAPPAEVPRSEPVPRSEEQPSPPPPMPPIKTVPEGGATPDTAGSPDNTGSRADLYRIPVNVNLVLVPVTVKDSDGHLVGGLLPKDFTVLEDGVKQQLRFFTSEPFPLSAAVILDLSMPDAAVQKVNQTFPALTGAFSQFDQVSLYTYSSAVSRLSDFSAVNQQLTAALNQLKRIRGSNNGPPVVSGPLASQGPIVNGKPIDSPVQPVNTPPREAHVLNDAVLRAALDLSKQERTRRKIVFIISDGREYGSNASYKDVLKVLLSNNVTVYAIGVEGAAVPGYGKLQRITHLPRIGYGDILPKYANATGGEVFNELSRKDIDDAYARIIGEARNQYTLGYSTRLTPSQKYRQLEVLVRRPGCKGSSARPCVSVYAKDGYYPLPPGR